MNEWMKLNESVICSEDDDGRAMVTTGEERAVLREGSTKMRVCSYKCRVDFVSK